MKKTGMVIGVCALAFVIGIPWGAQNAAADPVLPWMNEGSYFDYSVVANYTNPPMGLQQSSISVIVTNYNQFANTMDTAEIYTYPSASESVAINGSYDAVGRMNINQMSWSSWFWVAPEEISIGHARFADKEFNLVNILEDCYVFGMWDASGNYSSACFDKFEFYLRSSIDHIVQNGEVRDSITVIEARGTGHRDLQVSGFTGSDGTLTPSGTSTKGPVAMARGGGGPSPLQSHLWYTFTPPYYYGGGSTYEFQEGFAYADATHNEYPNTGRIYTSSIAQAYTPYGRARADAYSNMYGPQGLGSSFHVSKNGDYHLVFQFKLNGIAQATGTKCYWFGCAWADGFVTLTMTLYKESVGYWASTWYTVWRPDPWQGGWRLWYNTIQYGNLYSYLTTGNYYFCVSQTDVNMAAAVLFLSSSAQAVIQNDIQYVQVWGPSP